MACMAPLAAEEDRKERRRKLGLPEELTEEEKVGALAASNLHFHTGMVW